MKMNGEIQWVRSVGVQIIFPLDAIRVLSTDAEESFLLAGLFFFTNIPFAAYSVQML